MPIQWLAEAEEQLLGGKAAGLARLEQMGLHIPKTFVILQPEQPDWKPLLPAFLDEVPKAVRSSAAAEDGALTSFAGQFQTLLGVTGVKEVSQAVEACAASTASSRVEAYRDHLQPAASLRMTIIVQDMVDARLAGVLFTANPVNNRRDQCVIDVVEGLGDSLVGGESDGQHYVFSRSGKRISGPVGSEALLSSELRGQLLHESRQAAEVWGMPLDLEWAVDREGKLFWLQARPITTLSDVHFNELDTGSGQEKDILTRANIGEMMPGAVTPLTWSVFGRAIEVGMRKFFDACGALPADARPFRYIHLHYNHIFINVSSLYDMTRNVLLAAKENVEISVVGELIPGSSIGQKASWWRRVYNQVKQMRHLAAAGRMLTQLEVLAEEFSLRFSDEPLEMWQQLDSARETLNTAYAYHYGTSSQSGTYLTALLGMLSGDLTQALPEHHQAAARLLSNLGELESVGPLKALEWLAKEILEKDTEGTFPDASIEEALHFLKSRCEQEFAGFLERHGHRGVREAELWEPDWAENPMSVVGVLQTYVRQLKEQPEGSTLAQEVDFREDYAEIKAGLSLGARLGLQFVLPRARQGVLSRERSKSLCILLQKKMKAGYLHLAQKLVTEGKLGEVDHIFFLTHEEIGLLLSGAEGYWKEKARIRMGQHPHLMALSFPDLSYGLPEPEESFESAIPSESALKGLPVSQGRVEGPVRIVNTLAEAADLQAGEIMVAAYTDVGWTPFFSIIGGLITEIGSPLSHGAVVAREYGIPAVVSVKGARSSLKTGDYILLDGKRGIIIRKT